VERTVICKIGNYDKKSSQSFEENCSAITAFFKKNMYFEVSAETIYQINIACANRSSDHVVLPVYSTECVKAKINESSKMLSFFPAASIDFTQIRRIRTSINAKLRSNELILSAAYRTRCETTHSYRGTTPGISFIARNGDKTIF